MTDTRTGWIAFMARNPIAANLLMVVLLGGGIWTLIHIQKEVYPEYALDIVEVSVGYPGAAPTEVEQGILRPVEEAIRGVEGIAEVTSTAREGRGSVSIELVAGTDRMQAFQDIDQAITRIRTFPEDIDRPEVQLASNQRQVMTVGLYGDIDVMDLRETAENVRDQLQSVPGITSVELDRPPSYVTHVEIPADALRAWDLTLADVSRVIRASSVDTPGGAVETPTGEILLRVQERRQWADELAELPIVTSTSGATVRLGDIAIVRDGFEEGGFIGEFNRTPSIDIDVYRVGDQSPLDIADSVETTMRDLEASLPDGVAWRIDSNAAAEYRQRLGLLSENALMAVAIVLLVLALFLEVRLAFWVMMGMVISFVGGQVLLPAAGVSLNMISMFGFLVVLGIVVDDAIVVGENVYEYRRQGMSPMDAAIRGAQDVAKPVTFAILTNIIAFVPLLFIPGVTGKYWLPLPIVVIVVLLVSLVDALFILPAHLAHAPEKRGVGAVIARWQRAFADLFDRFVDVVYRAILDLGLRYRYVVATLAVTTLVIVGTYATSDHMGIVLMPENAADEIEAGVRLPVGSTIDQSAVVAREITDSTHAMFEAHDLFAQAEGIKTNIRGQSFVDVEIVLRPPDERTMTANEIIELWRDEIGDIAGVDRISFEAERGPGGWRQDIEIDLGHTDVDVLEVAAQALMAELETFENARDISDNLNRGKTRYDFTLRPEARLLGLTAEDVGRQLRDAYTGSLALRQLRGTNEVEVRVKLPRAERTSMAVLETLVLRTPDGVEVPLADVVDLHPTEAFTSISRRGGRRVVTVGLDVEPPAALSRVLASIESEVLPDLRAEHPGLTFSFEGSNAEMRESTQALYGGFGLALLVIFGLLAVALNSYTQPILVMGAIPFGLVGAVAGHMVLGYDLSLVSMMGVIALSGVVLNDSLIMIDHANRHRGTKSAFEAIRDAGVRRFRPIFLTTLTTFAGLTPIILETSGQARQVIPMAISLGFGIVFATAIILVLVPCLYLILDDLHRLVRPRTDAGPGDDANAPADASADADPDADSDADRGADAPA